MLAGSASAWQPLVAESDASKLRSLTLALLVHAVLAGLLLAATISAKPETSEAAGVPIEVYLPADLPKVPRPVATPPRPRVAPTPPRPAAAPKPVALPPDNVTDQRPVLPKPLPPDPLALALQEQEQQQQIEEARRQSKLEEVRQQQEEAKKAREALEAKLAELEAEEVKKAEEDLAQQVAEETAMAGNSADNSLLAQYTSVLVSVINNAWNRSSGVRPDLYCEILVTQLPGGAVMSAVPQRNCNGSEFERKALVDAVERASPLPYEGFQSVFRRQLVVPFQLPR